MKLTYAPGVKQIIRREQRKRLVKAVLKHAAIVSAYAVGIAVWLGLG